MEERKSYIEYCKDFIIDNISNYEDVAVYGCDLGYTLTEGINVDGSATYSTYEAKEYIKAWFDEVGEVYQYQKENYGECLRNPFEEPEAFHVCMIIEGVNALLSQCETVENAWNDEIELTLENIHAIIEELKEVEEINF